MHVLLATDGSDTSLSAASVAVDLLGAMRPQALIDIELVTVVPEVADPEEYAGGLEGPLGTPEQVDEARRAQRVDAAGLLAATARAAAPIPMTESVIEGDHVGRALLAHAEATGADIVVVGSHGHSMLKRAVLGSTTNYLVNHSACPVLVIPPPHDPPPQQDTVAGAAARRSATTDDADVALT